MAEDTEIEVVLKRSGLTFVVPPPDGPGGGAT